MCRVEVWTCYVRSISNNLSINHTWHNTGTFFNEFRLGMIKGTKGKKKVLCWLCSPSDSENSRILRRGSRGLDEDRPDRRRGHPTTDRP